MSVQHCACTALLYHSNMQQALIRRFAMMTTHHSRILIDRKHLVWREFAFIDTTRAHCQSQRITLHHRTQVTARAEQPTTRVKALRYRCEAGRKLRKAVRHERKDATKHLIHASQCGYGHNVK